MSRPRSAPATHSSLQGTARLLRGWGAALVATVVAAGSHTLADPGHHDDGPSPLVILLTLALAGPLCTALAGRMLSWTRLSAGVLLSQGLFHALYSLGSGTVTGSAGPAAGHSHHAQHLVVASGPPPTGRRPGPSEVIGRCALGRALIMIFRELVAALETPTVRWCCSDGGRPDPGLIKVNGALRPVLRTRSASAFDTMRPEGDASYQSMSPVSPERASVSHRGCMGSNGAGSSSGEKKPACEVSTPSGCI